MYLEEDNVDYDLLRNAVCDSMETSHKQASSFHMNCPLKSCRSCNAFAAATSSSNSSLSSHNAASTTTAQTNNNGDRYVQGDQEFNPLIKIKQFVQLLLYFSVVIIRYMHKSLRKKILVKIVFHLICKYQHNKYIIQLNLVTLMYN